MIRSIWLAAPMAIVGAALALTPILPTAALEAQEASPREMWMERLAAEAPGVWIASNADYLEEDGGTEIYGLDWQVLPGGVASRGCLWGETDGVATIFWEFSQLWDPVENRGIIYQSAPNGSIAIGYYRPEWGEAEGMVQVLLAPDGSGVEIRHTTEHDGPDIRQDRSFTREIGAVEWVPSRGYRWDRSMDHASPCT